MTKIAGGGFLGRGVKFSPLDGVLKVQEVN